MSERKSSPQCFELFEDEEEAKPPPMVKKEVSNAYFLLDLNLPRSPRRKKQDSILKRKRNEQSSSNDDVEVDGGDISRKDRPLKVDKKTNENNLPKFGFVEMLEKVHGIDLVTNNPWMNANVSKVNWKEQEKKRVRFCTTEINGMRAELPHCQRGHTQIKYGSLHAPTCKNAAHETVEVLGEHVWQNRGFILDLYIKNAQRRYSRSRSNSVSDSEEEGYYKARRESLEEIGVFDSVELAKIRMGMESEGANLPDLEPEPSTSAQEPIKHRTSLPLLHPDSAILNLELSSPISDEECPTTASTLKHLSDAAVTSSPADVFIFPPVSKQSHLSSSNPSSSNLSSSNTSSSNTSSSNPSSSNASSSQSSTSKYHGMSPVSQREHNTDSSSTSQIASQTNNRNENEAKPELATNDPTLESQFSSTENTFQFEMFTPQKLNKTLSHSDYGSEEADDDSETEESITTMLENLKTTSITFSPLEMSPKRSDKVTVTVEPPTPSASEPKIRSGFMTSDESARLRGTVKVNSRMDCVGSEGSGSSSRQETEDNIANFTQFMFENPSPNAKGR